MWTTLVLVGLLGCTGGPSDMAADGDAASSDTGVPPGDRRMGDGGTQDSEAGLPPPAVDASVDADASPAAPDAGDADTGLDAQAPDADGGDAAPTDGGNQMAPDSMAGTDAGAVPGTAGRDICGAMGAPAPGPGLTLALDTGPVGVEELQRSGDRIAYRGRRGRWALWDEASQQRLAIGRQCSEQGCPKRYFGLAGETLAVQSDAGVELRALEDGALRATIVDATGKVQLSVDGTYLWQATAPALTAWSTHDGQRLLEVAGNYATTSVHAGQQALRALRTVDGKTVMETIELASGHKSESPAVHGAHKGWFSDGNHFYTGIADIVRIYALDGQEKRVVGATSIDGHGNYFWTLGSSLDIYELDGGAAPIWSGAVSGQVAVQAGALVVLDQTTTVLTLTPIGLREVRQTLNWKRHGLHESRDLQIATDALGRYVVAGPRGVFTDSQLQATGDVRSYGCGAITKVAGSNDGLVAVGTAFGGIQILDTTVTPHFIRAIPFDTSDYHNFALKVTADGSLLGALGQFNDDSDGAHMLVFFEPRTGLEVGRFTGRVIGFSMSNDGGRVAVRTGTATITDPTGMSTVFERPFSDVHRDGSGAGYLHAAPLLSPDGRYAVFWSPGEGRHHTTLLANTTSVIYRDGRAENLPGGYPVGQIDGYVAGWLDHERVLVAHVMERYGTATWLYVCDSGSIRAASGATLVSTPLCPMWPLRVINPDRIFARSTVYDVTTGAVVWSSSLARGVWAGTHVVAVEDGSRLLMEAAQY